MKRILSLMLALALCLTLAACGGGSTTEAQTSGDAQTAEPSEPSDTAETDTVETAGEPVSFADLAVEDKITMGTWEGAPLNWTVIGKGVGTALVLCDNVIAQRIFGEGNVAWKDSDLFKYLNGEFYTDVFTDQERERIVKSHLTNDVFDFDSYTTLEEESDAWVFLLSGREFLLYVTPIQDLCYGVPLESIREDVYMADVNDPVTVQQACSWDLRDDGETQSYNVLSVDGWDGRLDKFGSEKAREVSIRPAMWVYTDQALAEGWKAGETSLPADETLNAALADLHKGDQVSFGRFCDQDFRDGHQDIPWTVVDEGEDALLLYSDALFGTERFSQSQDESVTWETSYLRSYINSDSFIDRYFNPWERSKIRLTHNTTSSGDPMWERDGGAETDDYLFVPDQEEILEYFPQEGDRTVDEEGYWLRNPDFAPGFFSVVIYGGPISTDDAVSPHNIRLAMWIDK